jgi:tetratricopeptide (TPR) repeat protein
MSFFDPQDKKNKPVLDYFDNKTWLIVENSAQTRVSIKKALSMMGARNNNMFDADNFKDAQSIIVSKKPNFVFGSEKINGGLLTSLFKVHLINVPNRLNAGFFLLAEESLVTDIALALEYEMDGIVTLPYTGFTIVDTVLSGMTNKIYPSAYILKLEEARQLYLTDEKAKAIDLFSEAIELHTHPYEAHFFLGKIYEDNNLTEKAMVSFEESHLHNSDYFRALKHLGSIYYQTKDFKKAYEINFLMAKKYPVLPEKIPELIRLSIINKKYEDINNYLKIFSNTKTVKPETEVSLAAGLAVLGKYFVQNHENEKGLAALKAAFKFSNGKYEILDSIMNTFEECRSLDVLLELFDSTDLSQWSENIQGLYFHTLHYVSSDDAMVLSTGEQLLKKKIKNVHIYRGLIERAIRMHRKIGKIEGLVLEAITTFPDKRDEFEQMLELAKKNA